MLSEQLDVLHSSLTYVDHLFVDDSVLSLEAAQTVLHGAKCSLRCLHFKSGGQESISANVVKISDIFDLSKLVDHSSQENIRVLAGSGLAASLGFDDAPALLMPSGESSNVEWKQLPLRKTRTLHVIGSCTSAYYEGVSRYYGTQCIRSVAAEFRFEHFIAYVHLSGEWSVAAADTVLDNLDTDAGVDRIPLHAALARIQELNIDVVVPHMFDYMGMTAYRSLFEIIGLPSIGCDADALALSTNKARTKAVAAMSGVRVPESVLVRRGDDCEAAIALLPVVVKPTEEDNSMGVTLVRNSAELAPALRHAFEFGDEALVERFVPLGRELRVGLMERADGSLRMLPIIEYFLPESAPIRTPDDKVATGADGLPVGLASGGRACPASVDDALRDRLFETAARAHRALGCRHYSIFDFRVNPDDVPYLLESCLYCSFAPKSALITMADAAGLKHPQVFVELAERVSANIRREEEKTMQKFGMKKRS